MLHLYKRNQYIRKPLRIKEFRPIEKEYRREYTDTLFIQNKKVFTKDLISNVYNYYQSLKVKKTDQEEELRDKMLEMYVQNRLVDNRELRSNSKTSNKLKKITTALFIRTIETGLRYDKLRTIQQLRVINDRRIKDVVNGISFDIKLSNPRILDTIDKYSLTLITDLNKVQKVRIKNLLVSGVKSGRSVGEITKDISKLNKMSQRRAWTIVRTEIGQAKALENEQYLTKRGFQEWTWICQQPDDAICLMACGVTRRIGESFPNGLTSPLAHANCQCTTEGHIPEDKINLGILIGSIIIGIDWLGK